MTAFPTLDESTETLIEHFLEKHVTPVHKAQAKRDLQLFRYAIAGVDALLHLKCELFTCKTVDDVYAAIEALIDSYEHPKADTDLPEDPLGRDTYSEAGLERK